jgi:DNA-directed RNA polymerase subunit omega
MNIQNDGMRYPSIDQLATKTSSKYKLVIGAAMRAKEIKKGDKVLVENPRSKKSIGMALEEVISDKVIIK